MTNTYQYYSKHVGTNITVSYQDGKLKSFEAEEPCNAESGGMRLITNEIEFLEQAKSRNIKYIRVTREVSFEVFYEVYNYKRGKIAAERAWRRLSKADQVEAVDFIKMYDSQLKLTGISKMYPATYLNEQRWKDMK